ncbi:MAG TPA: TIGR03085 family metal-binding protein [Chloroflexota bacterium]|nr:TIGR03085 family metal-binding protein [Chloroflexota bacterium]
MVIACIVCLDSAFAHFPLHLPSAMEPFHRRERRLLADLLLQLGPEAPTLCDGWLARDLAAHLVLRESTILASAGIVLGPLAGRTAAVQARLGQQPWEQLVQAVRDGPPRRSPMRIPLIDRGANTLEFFIHHEDVRRAQAAWAPRQLDAEAEQTVWKNRRSTRFTLGRQAQTGIVLRWPDHEDYVVKGGEPRVVLSGAPSELMLYASGRRQAAAVGVEGPPEALAYLSQG